MQNETMNSQTQVLETCYFLEATDTTCLQDSLKIAIQSQQYPKLIIDMRQIELLDSNGLMAIVSALTIARKLNQQVTFYKVSREILLLLEIVQLDQFFEISESSSSRGETCYLRL